MSANRRAAASLRSRQGSVLMIVLILMAMLAMLPIAMQMVSTNRRNADAQLNAVAQANNLARAGLLDAMGWFRRQHTQPVSANGNIVLYPYPDAAFRPVFSTNTAQSDTMDANVGIVQQFQISNNNVLWGRYEVHMATQGLSGDPNSVHDITALRVPGQSAGAGAAWYIESTGIVFRNNNPALPYSQSPNFVVGTAKMATEIRRVSLSTPVNAAIIVNSGTGDSLSNNGRVIGGGSAAGFAYYGATSPCTANGALISGNPSCAALSPSTGSVNTTTIFGMSAHDLSLLADYSVTSAAQLPASYPAQAIVYVNGNANFTIANSLVGGGILYVTGTLTMASTASALFSGVIYAGGNVSISGPALVSGTLITNGTVTISGAGDAAFVQYSNSVVNGVQTQVAQYRESRSEYYTFTAFK